MQGAFFGGEHQDPSGQANMGKPCSITRPCGEEPGYSLREKIRALFCFVRENAQEFAINKNARLVPVQPKGKGLGSEEFHIPLQTFSSFGLVFFFCMCIYGGCDCMCGAHMDIEYMCTHVQTCMCKRIPYLKPSVFLHCFPPYSLRKGLPIEPRSHLLTALASLPESLMFLLGVQVDYHTCPAFTWMLWFRALVPIPLDLCPLSHLLSTKIFKCINFHRSLKAPIYSI